MRIEYLADLPEAAGELERWFVEEWAPWYGPGGGGDAAADLAASMNRNALPICLVALGPKGDVRGTVSLKADSVGSEWGYGPWLAALLVAPQYRRRGVAGALVARIESEARRLGYGAVYSSTDTSAAILERRGWTPIGGTDSLRGPLTIYRWSAEPDR